ncbi:hypothetical protein GTY86_38040 [Streptomyces sp. SID5770]|nr:hypothetical protein [Streptomyces sp. SID5770]
MGLARSSPDRSLADVAHGLGVHVGTLRKWAREDRTRAHAAGSGRCAGMIPDEMEELKRLRRESARLEEDDEILRKAAACFVRGTTRRSASVWSTSTRTPTG